MLIDILESEEIKREGALVESMVGGLRNIFGIGEDKK